MPRSAAAFTVIDLLLVVSIVAILVALPLPTIDRAREAAIDALCLSRLRQDGVALFTYAADHKQFIPPGHVGDLPSRIHASARSHLTASRSRTPSTTTRGRGSPTPPASRAA